jgi:hypothetical protein
VDSWQRRRRRLGRRGGAAQVEAGRRQRQRRRRRCDGGVWIDNLIASLFSVDIIIFTSTKSEHSDSPWCEPITPLFSEVRLSEAKKHACGRTIILGGEDRRQSTNYVLSGCKCPNAQFTSTGNGSPISSTGTSTGSAKSHFRYCVDHSFSSFSGSGTCSVTSGVIPKPREKRFRTLLLSAVLFNKNASALFFRALLYSTKIKRSSTYVEKRFCSSSGTGPSE